MPPGTQGKRPPSRLGPDGLYEKAVRALARRGRSETEIRRLLRPRAALGEAGAGDIEAVVARLRDHGYLDDARLAHAAASYQKEVNRHGAGRALRDLRARGVAVELAAEAVRQGYADSNEDALLRAYLQKKRLRRPEDMRQAGNVYRKLLLAGFSPAACQRCLRAWKLDPEMLETLEAGTEAVEAASQNDLEEEASE